jgi:hypothetical protein
MTRLGTGDNKVSFHRKTLSISTETLVRVSPLGDHLGYPILVEPAEDVELRFWLQANPQLIDKWLMEYGGILFRGFHISGISGFEESFRAACGELLEYKERSSPRRTVEGRIYTSSDLPETEAIFPHNENSYQSTWPMRIGFFCAAPPVEGGATPLVSSRLLYSVVPSMIRTQFEQKGLLYIRRYSGIFGLSWQEAFQTEDRTRVVEYCRTHGLQLAWGADQVETRGSRPAVVRHPLSDERLWFNHAAFFHASTVPKEIATLLLAQFGPERSPNDVRFGDGSAIDDSMIQEIRSITEKNRVRFPWKKSDFLLLDNMLTLHGRDPFKGERQIVVAMARPHHAD